MNNTLIVIVGTTAIGKTAKAIELAKIFNSEIISCDSRQFFKEMTIGTAVPSLEELKQVKHHFIQNISIHNNYNVGDFEKDALNKLNDLFKINPIQIMVGGSGLYVDAVTKGFDEFPEINPIVREDIKEKYQQNGIEYLQELLKQHDLNYYNKLLTDNPQTLENPQRIMRFLEVSIGSGKPYSSYINQKSNHRNFNIITIGLDADREIIYNRINTRVDLMIKNGLLKEAADLIEYQHLNALQTVGYRELFDYFNEKTSLEFAIEEIKKNTRRFAKRQLTWFKRNPDTLWFNYDAKAEDIAKEIKKKL